MKDGILHKAESPKQKKPLTIMTVHTNGTIRVAHGNKSEQINAQRVEPFFENEEYVVRNINYEICVSTLKKVLCLFVVIENYMHTDMLLHT